MEKAQLKDRITSCLDRLGPYHIFLLVILNVYSIATGVSHGLTVFHTYTPKFYCDDNDTPRVNNSVQWGVCRSGLNCTFDPDDEYKSIVTDFNLVCSQRYLAPLSSTIYFIGVTIGALVFGPVSDNFGRKPTIFICTAGHFILGLLICFSSVTFSIETFMALRLIQGFFTEGMQGVSFTTIVELCPIRLRATMGFFWEISWAAALIYLGILAKFIVDWRTLQMVLLIFSGLGMIIIVFLPESMQWLWTKNKLQEVIKVYMKIARKNKDADFLHYEIMFQEDKNWKDIERSYGLLRESKSPPTVLIYKQIFQNLILKTHILISGSFWFISALSYWSMTFFVPSLFGDRHINFISGAGIEMIGFVITFAIMSRIGRRIPLYTYIFINGLLCIIFACLTLISTPSTELEILKNVLVLTSRAMSSSQFCILIVYTRELFPTTCRGTSIGYCGFLSRFGCLIAPQFVSLAEFFTPLVPITILGVGFIILATTFQLLPETFKIEIPNTFEDVKKLWGNEKLNRKRKCCF